MVAACASIVQDNGRGLMSSVRTILQARMLVLATLTFAVVFYAVSCDAPAKADQERKIMFNCGPSAKVAPADNGATISLKCHADVVVELIAKMDQVEKVEKVTVNCDPTAGIRPGDHSATIELNCGADLRVELPTTVKCDAGAKVAPSAPDNSVTIRLTCGADVKVKLLPKVDQAKAITLNCGSSAKVDQPAAGNKSPIIRLKCSANVTVELLPKVDKAKELTLDCGPSAKVDQPASTDNSATIRLDCGGDVRVELQTQMDPRHKITLDCGPTAEVGEAAPGDNGTTIKLKCDDVKFALPEKNDAKCDRDATVDQSALGNNGVTIALKCGAIVKVELQAKADPAEKVTLNCSAGAKVASADNSAWITLPCEVDVKERNVKVAQQRVTLNCDRGAPEATYILDQAANRVTYRNARFRPEKPGAKNCPEKTCALDEKGFVYCETWENADFTDKAVRWVRCGQDKKQTDEVTIDLQSGVMRQKFIGSAVRGIADRYWTCKAIKPTLITVKNAEEEGAAIKTSTTNNAGEVTITVKVTTETGSPAVK